MNTDPWMQQCVCATTTPRNPPQEVHQCQTSTHTHLGTDESDGQDTGLVLRAFRDAVSRKRQQMPDPYTCAAIRKHSNLQGSYDVYEVARREGKVVYRELGLKSR
jgi:hypothetical protein